MGILYGNRHVLINRSALIYYSYSRRIIWMQCVSSNNDPGIIAQYYFDALKIIQGIYSTVVSVNINGVPQLHA